MNGATSCLPIQHRQPFQSGLNTYQLVNLLTVEGSIYFNAEILVNSLGCVVQTVVVSCCHCLIFFSSSNPRGRFCYRFTLQRYDLFLFYQNFYLYFYWFCLNFIIFSSFCNPKISILVFCVF